MLNISEGFLIYLLLMALVTYLVRMLPLVLFRRKITNKYISSFLYYIPYAVLSAMTFPAILYSTSSMYSAMAGTLAALLLSYKKQSLIVVAAASCVTVFLTELLIGLLA